MAVRVSDAIAFQLVRPGDRTSIKAGGTPASPVTVLWVRPGDRTSIKADETPAYPVTDLRVRPGDRTSIKAGGDACAP
ncbi:MAG: hypothetical protein ACI30J_09455 [Paludibacteraceae bacterium]